MIHRNGILAMLALGILAARGLSDAHGLQDSGIDCRSISSSQDEVEHYWTRERTAAAEPLPLPDLSDEELQVLLDPEDAVSEAGGQSEETLQPRPWLIPGQPSPANVGRWPFRTAGRLFFTVGKRKKPKWCTAELTGTGHTLLTAAHCVRNGKENGTWHSDFYFVRAYQKGGGEPMKLRLVAIWKRWMGPMHPDYSFDYAVLSTAESSDVGWLGLSSPLGHFSWTAIGYPSNYGEGQVMYQVLGWLHHRGGGLVAMQGNPMDAGSSGGAWIGSFSAGYAIGLNSFIYDGLVYGPLFNQKTAFLLSHVANGCR